MNKIYAKTMDNETLDIHTNLVLKGAYDLKRIYEKEIEKSISDIVLPKEFWKYLFFCCKYHDFGKIDLKMQISLLEKIDNNKAYELKNKYGNVLDRYEKLPHNLLSPAFIPKEERQAIVDPSNPDKKLIKKILYQVIAYHHERDKYYNDIEIVNYINNVLILSLNEYNLDTAKLFTNYVKYLRKEERILKDNRYYKLYIMLKGLLVRCDYAGSAHKNIEDEDFVGIGKATKLFLEGKYGGLRDIQKFCFNNKDFNLVLIGSTGIGKTEACLLFIDNYKGFITLPIQISLNDLYRRIKDDIKYNNVGLLHSNAKKYVCEVRNEEEDIVDESFLLSKKITFSTVDQILKCSLMPLQYERELSTLAYSKLVIDEIQAYNPKMSAIILHSLKYAVDLNCKFLIMTATLPRLYKEKLEEFNIDFKYNEFLLEKQRHFIKMIGNDIFSSIDDVLEAGKTKKVLVIVNTVKQAIDYYLAIMKKNNLDIDINLLHSLFTMKDRRIKEENIKVFANGEDSGIWITTQIVEASLDIDFDCLFTEMSSLDSLFQRLGRCFRNREYLLGIPNIFIYYSEISGYGSVYDKDIINYSISLLLEYDNSLLSEKTKVNLVDKLYSRKYLESKKSKFLKIFDETCAELERLRQYQITSKIAQKELRDMENIFVIPKSIYIGIRDLLKKLDGANSYKEKKEIEDKLKEYSISVRKTKVDKYSRFKTGEVEVNNTYITIMDLPYNNKTGLIFN